MSDTDSFIDEVSEEVRRDKLFGYLKKYGWIAVLLVLLLVGGAAYNEWRKANAAAEAQAAGDALMAALEQDAPEARAAALAEIGAEGASAPVVAMLTAAEQEQTGDIAGAVATLEELAANSDVSRDYRDLAQFKALMISDGVTDPADRRAGFEAMAAPGQPYALLALEQIALLDIAEGDTEAALAGLALIVQDADVTRGQQVRAVELLIALGGDPDALVLAE